MAMAMAMAFFLQDGTYTILSDFLKAIVAIEGSGVLVGSTVRSWDAISADSIDGATVTVNTNRTVESEWRVSE